MSRAEEAKALLEAERADLEAQLKAALDERKEANDRVLFLRKKLAEAPRLHVKRRTKPAATPGPIPEPSDGE